MNRLKRLYCWLAGHDWVRLLQDDDRAFARAGLHPMAGCMGYCARCGYMFDDFPVKPRVAEPEPREAGPYRTPMDWSLPKCRCSGGKVHRDCPIHLDLSQFVVEGVLPPTPKPPKPPNAAGTFYTRTTTVTTETSSSPFSDIGKSMSEAMKHVTKAMGEVSKAMDSIDFDKVEKKTTRRPKDSN